MILVALSVAWLITVAICLLWLFSRLDCDLTLYCAQLIGFKASKLRNKVVWITGASSGIGEALAYELSAAGAILVISGRNVSRLEQVMTNCIERYNADNRIFCLPFDITDYDVHEKCLQTVLDSFERVDILVNNAGLSQRADFHETEIRVDAELFNVNVFGTINLARTVLNHWYSTRRHGHLVLTSTVGAIFAARNCASYAASKAALQSYFDTIRNEGHDRNVKVTTVLPGPTFSRAAERSLSGKYGQTVAIVHNSKMKRMAPSRVAHSMAVAMVNGLDEAWICSQPVLLILYFIQYFPALSKWLIAKYLTKQRLIKLREG
ncbi:Dehydrogenase/reductase SDR family member 7 [Halotydeus destructor]|nr:Dehydrogenase/reductase SDR family member 7 [Halotydeus destructor]